MIFNDKSLTQYETGIYTALFHDIIYNPKRNDNELKSSEYFRKFNSEHNIVSQNDEKIICHIINETDYKNLEINDMDGVPKSLVKRFMEYDLASFKKPFSEILSDEKKIRKEYQWVDWYDYQQGRLSFLDRFKDHCVIKSFGQKAIDNINYQIEFLKFDIPKIALYPGTFNPFHLGHLKILEYAETIFDKVIIAFGKNSDKEENLITIPETLNFHQTLSYSSSLVDLLNEFKYPLTVIRGIRNSTDMQYEMNQFKWLKEMKYDIKVVNIFCDKDYEHISSSALKTIKKYDEKIYKHYLVK